MSRSSGDWRDKTKRRATAEVRVKLKDGSERIETWEGISYRHAGYRARAYYRDDDTVDRVDLASGEPL